MPEFPPGGKLPPLADYLRREASSAAGLPFSGFMRAALYHPAEGYYTRKREHPAGRRGDFVTAPEMTPAFGRLAGGFLARHVPAPFHLADWGAGRGLLAKNALAALPARSVRSVTLVERHASAEEAAAALRAEGYDARAAMEYAAASADGTAHVHLANEFLDAFPLEVLRRAGGGWQRLFVRAEGEDFVEDWRPCEDAALLDYAARYAEKHVEEGQRMEVFTGWEEWLDGLARPGGAPLMALVFDYGGMPEELFAKVRRFGTLRCFHKHALDTNPLAHPGEKDITASLNFAFLEDLARARGLAAKTVELSAFLIQAGAEALLQEGALPDGERRALVEVMDPSAMGGLFKACVLTRGMPAPEWKTFRELAFGA